MAAVEENGKFVPRIKVSENIEKITNPGLKKVLRVYDENGHAAADMIALREEEIDFSKPVSYIDEKKAVEEALL